MKVLIFGASGMIGQGVLRECLADPEIEQVVSIGRSAPATEHSKLVSVVHSDLLDLSSIETRLSGFDACFYCLGVSSAGMSEADYASITYELTLSVARTLVRLNPTLNFIYISGSGADSSEKGSSMWARVKGKTENALLREAFKGAYMFRPGFIQPRHGIRSRTALYRAVYAVLGPCYPLLKRMAPGFVTTTELVGRAMVQVAKSGASKPLLETSDINEIASASSVGQA